MHINPHFYCYFYCIFVSVFEVIPLFTVFLLVCLKSLYSLLDPLFCISLLLSFLIQFLLMAATREAEYYLYFENTQLVVFLIFIAKREYRYFEL